MSVFSELVFFSFSFPEQKPERHLARFAEDERWRGAGDKETAEKARWWNSRTRNQERKIKVLKAG